MISSPSNQLSFFFFCQQKLVLCHSNNFQGVYLEKCETTESKVCFKESKNVGHFDLDTVVSVLISALTVNSSFVEVDIDEIDEILATTNTEM